MTREERKSIQEEINHHRDKIQDLRNSKSRTITDIEQMKSDIERQKDEIRNCSDWSHRNGLRTGLNSMYEVKNDMFKTLRSIQSEIEQHFGEVNRLKEKLQN